MSLTVERTQCPKCHERTLAETSGTWFNEFTCGCVSWSVLYEATCPCGFQFSRDIEDAFSKCEECKHE